MDPGYRQRSVHESPYSMKSNTDANSKIGQQERNMLEMQDVVDCFS